jgi:hypothetical protein
MVAACMAALPMVAACRSRCRSDIDPIVDLLFCYRHGRWGPPISPAGRLDALLDERSVTRAAARLGYRRSTVSGMLARLRDLFRNPLFVRTQRRVLPTLRAEARASPLMESFAGKKGEGVAATRLRRARAPTPPRSWRC